MNEIKTRDLIVQMAKSLFDRGLTFGSSGNISVRMEDGWLMTPTGCSMGNIEPEKISKLDEIDFVRKIYPVYKAIELAANDNLVKNKSMIGFVGAPWTLLVYMINKQSPKIKLKNDFFKIISFDLNLV